MVDPLFWLGLSILLVAVSLTAVLVAAVPAFQELARAARSAEKLFDTLSRELPPTLESIRLTGQEISSLTDDMSEGVQNASRVVQQIDQGVSGTKQNARQAEITTRSVMAGVKAAWKVLTRPAPRRPIEHPVEHLSSQSEPEVEWEDDSIESEYPETEEVRHPWSQHYAEPAENTGVTSHLAPVDPDGAAAEPPEMIERYTRLSGESRDSS